MRALIARDVTNLFLGGRCISGDFIAHSSYRVTGTAAATGQASGVAATLGAEKKLFLPSRTGRRSKPNLTP
jgi:hypothetical protein